MRYSVLDGMNWKERQAYREKRKGEIAAEKAAKAATAKTCQCCARPIFAETGTIAHHGYERPGYGYQTASCMGAKYLPFEVSRDRLGDLIGMLKDRLAGAAAARADAEAEKRAIPREYTNYNAPRIKVPGKHDQYPIVKLDFTRENFATLIEQNTGPRGDGKVFDSYDAGNMIEKGGFDKIKAEDLDSRDRQIKNIKEHIAECEKRFKNWKPTLKWVDGEWVNLETEAA